MHKKIMKESIIERNAERYADRKGYTDGETIEAAIEAYVDGIKWYLKKIWRKWEECRPDPSRCILCRVDDCDLVMGASSEEDGSIWFDDGCEHDIIEWCYLEDVLGK